MLIVNQKPEKISNIWTSTLRTLKNILMLLAYSLLAACVSSLPTKYNSQEFAKNQKAVVIVRISQHTPTISNGANVSLNYVLRRIGQDGDYFIYGSNAFFLSAKHDYAESILMLDPGIYYLDSITLLRQYDATYSYPSPGIETIPSDKLNYACRFNYGAFKVNASEVVYLGHLNLGEDRKLPFKNFNEIEKAKSDLMKKSHNNLALKLKPAQFYQTGSIYVEPINGKTTFFSSDELNYFRQRVYEKLIDEL